MKGILKRVRVRGKMREITSSLAKRLVIFSWILSFCGETVPHFISFRIRKIILRWWGNLCCLWHISTRGNDRDKSILPSVKLDLSLANSLSRWSLTQPEKFPRKRCQCIMKRQERPWKLVLQLVTGEVLERQHGFMWNQRNDEDGTAQRTAGAHGVAGRAG